MGPPTSFQRPAPRSPMPRYRTGQDGWTNKNSGPSNGVWRNQNTNIRNRTYSAQDARWNRADMLKHQAQLAAHNARLSGSQKHNQTKHTNFNMRSNTLWEGPMEKVNEGRQDPQPAPDSRNFEDRLPVNSTPHSAGETSNGQGNNTPPDQWSNGLDSSLEPATSLPYHRSWAMDALITIANRSVEDWPDDSQKNSSSRTTQSKVMDGGNLKTPSSSSGNRTTPGGSIAKAGMGLTTPTPNHTHGLTLKELAGTVDRTVADSLDGSKSNSTQSNTPSKGANLKNHRALIFDDVSAMQIEAPPQGNSHILQGTTARSAGQSIHSG